MRSKLLIPTLMLAALWVLVSIGSPAPATGQLIALREGCEPPEDDKPPSPFYATTLLSYSGWPDVDPSIVVFRDTDVNRLSARFPLATFAETGSIFGLAYDWRRGHLYAGAFQQYGIGFGPAGPGGVYRVDLATGAVEAWTALDAGDDPSRAGAAHTPHDHTGLRCDSLGWQDEPGRPGPR